MTTKGHCYCRKTGWEFAGEVTWACYCHCDACRRNYAAPIVAWLGVPLKNFTWIGLAPRTYETEKGICRHFCGTCGSPIGFEANHYAGGMQLYAASLDNPENFKPTFYVNYESKLPCLDIHDELTKHKGTLLESSEDLSQYQ